MQLSVGSLLNSLEKKRDQFQTRWSMKLSYVEIYKEKVYDLLNPGVNELQLREDVNRNIVIPGLVESEIMRVNDFMTVFEFGTKNRSMASTKLNSQSSRSHACLMLVIEQRPPIGPAIRSKLHLIDLAGSEDNRRTENTGARLVESGAINSSLFVLGQVVDALNKRSPRIPYRDSKLTRLLQDSLGGKAHALVIANVAPTMNWLAETAATLNFASKSRNIQNRVIKNLIDADRPQRKKRSKRIEEDDDVDSVYELSEADPPSSVIKKRAKKASLISPPESNPFIRASKECNPFVADSNPIESALERQIEEKVAAKLREISKGTILSPLLKSRQGELDLKTLKKVIKKPSALRENADPNVTRTKSKKQQLEDMKAIDEMKGIMNMFPTVEPDLLHIFNYASANQLKKLKELGQTRAESIIASRTDVGFKEVVELEAKGIVPAKILLKIVYANAMDADGLASLAHNIRPE